MDEQERGVGLADYDGAHSVCYRVGAIFYRDHSRRGRDGENQSTSHLRDIKDDTSMRHLLIAYVIAMMIGCGEDEPGCKSELRCPFDGESIELDGICGDGLWCIEMYSSRSYSCTLPIVERCGLADDD